MDDSVDPEHKKLVEFCKGEKWSEEEEKFSRARWFWAPEELDAASATDSAFEDLAIARSGFAKKYGRAAEHYQVIITPPKIDNRGRPSREGVLRIVTVW